MRAPAGRRSKANPCAPATSPCWCVPTPKPRGCGRRWRWPAFPRSPRASSACSPPPRRANCTPCCWRCCMRATTAACARRSPPCWSAWTRPASMRSTRLSTAMRTATGSSGRCAGANACCAAARWRWSASCAPATRNACSACSMANAASATTCSWPKRCRKHRNARSACTAWSTGSAGASPAPTRTTKPSCCGWNRTRAACRSSPCTRARAWNTRWCSCRSRASAATKNHPAGAASPTTNTTAAACTGSSAIRRNGNPPAMHGGGNSAPRTRACSTSA